MIIMEYFILIFCDFLFDFNELFFFFSVDIWVRNCRFVCGDSYGLYSEYCFGFEVYSYFRCVWYSYFCFGFWRWEELVLEVVF